MPNLLIPALALIVLPALYLGVRLGLHRDRRICWVGGILLALVTLKSMPWAGLDFAELKKINLFLCAAVAALYGARSLGIAKPSGLGKQSSRRVVVLGLLTAIAVVSYLNFFSFHGERTWVHLHDVAHYYLGAKYYDELGYGDLYTGILRAEAELYDNHFKTVEARDLQTYDIVHIKTLLERKSGAVRAAFTDARWRDFKADVRYFRDTLGPHYATVLIDHGFNPTPVWALIGRALAQPVAGGDAHGIFLLTLLDAVLLAAAFAAVGWAFGLETMLLAVFHYCVVFGSNFGWTGGGYLRYLWFFGLVAGVCCMRRGRYGAAGALLGLATMLRVFPFFFAAPLVFRGLHYLWRRRRLPRRETRFVAGFAVTCSLLFALSLLVLPKGFDHWTGFRTNMQLHVANIAPNVVGMTDVLAHRPGAGKVTQEEFNALKVRRQRIYSWQLALLFVPALVVAARLSRWQTDLGAMVLALPLLLCGLTLAAYYYVFIVLYVLQRRRSPRDLALIFALEALSYVLFLFEDHEGLLYIYRSLQVGYLYLALHLPTLSRELRLWRARA